MIRKLRKKLIAVSMVSLCIVLFCIFGFVGILNYQKMVSDADHTLSILADNDGTFPEPKDDEPDHAGKHRMQRIPRNRIHPARISALLLHHLIRQQTQVIPKTTVMAKKRPTSRSQNSPPGTQKTPRSFPLNPGISLSCSAATMPLSCPSIPA